MNVLSHDQNPKVLSVQVQAILEHGFDAENLLILAPEGKKDAVEGFGDVRVETGSGDIMVKYDLSEVDKTTSEEALGNGEYILLSNDEIADEGEFFQ